MSEYLRRAVPLMAVANVPVWVFVFTTTANDANIGAAILAIPALWGVNYLCARYVARRQAVPVERSKIAPGMAGALGAASVPALWWVYLIARHGPQVIQALPALAVLALIGWSGAVEGTNSVKKRGAGPPGA